MEPTVSWLVPGLQDKGEEAAPTTSGSLSLLRTELSKYDGWTHKSSRSAAWPRTPGQLLEWPLWMATGL